MNDKDSHSKTDILLKSLSHKKYFENKEIYPKDIPHFKLSEKSVKQLKIKKSLSHESEKIIDLIPLKSIPDLFINYNIVQIDENGLHNCDKNTKYNKVIFKLNQEINIPSPAHFSTSDNNINKIDNNHYYEENDINANTILLSNKIDPKQNKSLSIFSVHYNRDSNKYILTSLSDEIYFSLEIWSNKNMHLDNLKRYYIQLSDIIISILPNNIEKNIKIKILNLDTDDKNKHKYFFDKNNLSIKIGRNDCNININKESISKVHLIIDYDKFVNKYYIRDNYSTNGSLIILKKGKDIELKDKMFFFSEKVHFTLKR
jgi:hypothetical protein